MFLIFAVRRHFWIRSGNLPKHNDLLTDWKNVGAEQSLLQDAKSVAEHGKRTAVEPSARTTVHTVLILLGALAGLAVLCLLVILFVAAVESAGELSVKELLLVAVLIVAAIAYWLSRERE